LEGFALVLVLISALGLWPRRRLYASFTVAVIIAWVLLPVGIKPPAVGELLTEKESAYNYIQVVKAGTTAELLLNEGLPIQSEYDPPADLTHGYWDSLLVADGFQPARGTETPPGSLAILGLAGGTTARQYRLAYGSSIDITGVEIDPEILALGHEYFHL